MNILEIEDIHMFPKIRRIGEQLIQNPIMKKLSTNSNTTNSNNGGLGDNNNGNRLSRWHNHNSSRIIRISRASGGKDRHSKVWTSKGLRDRRVRLSVSTALQFYDLQDRLGYDQPSKAVEWLIVAAADAISELPSLNTSNFPGGDDDGNLATSENNKNPNSNPNTNPDTTGSCSSNSETNKNSGLSLSRSEIREKARERERERMAKEKEKVNDNVQASFTELLTGSATEPNPTRQWMDHSPPVHHAATMEYLSSGLILGSGQIQFPHQTVSTPYNSISDHHHHHHHRQEFSFVPEHLFSPSGGGGGGGGGSYSLDFNISSSTGGATAAAAGLGGFSRGTLQSNSPNQQSFLNNLQRFSSDGAGAPFFVGALPVENHNHNQHFQLYYDNGSRNSDQKGKGKR